MEYKQIDRLSIKKYPTLDLHGQTREVIIPLIDIFIKDCYILGEKQIVIMHGIGKNIIKKEVHEYLKKRKDIIKYHLITNNLGCTIVYLKD